MSEITYSIIDASKVEEVSELLLNSFFLEEPLGVALGKLQLYIANYAGVSSIGMKSRHFCFKFANLSSFSTGNVAEIEF